MTNGRNMQLATLAVAAVIALAVIAYLAATALGLTPGGGVLSSSWLAGA